MADGLEGIAIVLSDPCKLEKSKQSCLVVQRGNLSIKVSSASNNSDKLCNEFGSWVKRRPFEATQIINLPEDLVGDDTIHCYGPNSFKLHRLPVPRPGQVLGLVGKRSIGKSTTLKVLLGRIKPNLGRFDNPPDWKEILTHFGESELQNYFTRLLEDNLKDFYEILGDAKAWNHTSTEILKMMKSFALRNGCVCLKRPSSRRQHIKFIIEVQGIVGQVLDRKDEREMKGEICRYLELEQVMDRNVLTLSSGELQRFQIAVAAVQKADIHMFDEPSNFLDVKQRLKAAQVIRSLLRPNSYVVVVDHDLSVLDYLSDYICCLYGKPEVHGVVTLPYSVRHGINIFLAGYIPTDNLQFQEESFQFKVAETPQGSTKEIQTHACHRYPTMTETLGTFKLKVIGGEFTDSQIIVILGENGTGKTTFLRMLAEFLRSDAAEGADVDVPKLNFSNKPQKLGRKFTTTVRYCLRRFIPGSYRDRQFRSDVMKPLQIDRLMDEKVENISHGDFQNLALCCCLGMNVDVYLIDEPSAYLDADQCLVASKVIRRYIHRTKKTAFVVEHDFTMATYLADRVIVFEGVPSMDCTASAPQSLVTGMNLFLSHLNITCRQDPTNHRQWINKLDSTEDREQKSAGSYYYLDD